MNRSMQITNVWWREKKKAYAISLLQCGVETSTITDWVLNDMGLGEPANSNVGIISLFRASAKRSD